MSAPHCCPRAPHVPSRKTLPEAIASWAMTVAFRRRLPVAEVLAQVMHGLATPRDPRAGAQMRLPGTEDAR